MRIAFLGLGNMGRPMARNLAELGHAVTVYNRTPGKAEALVALGAKEASTVAEAVARAEVAITMLAGESAVREVVEGPGGMLQSLPPKAIHLCMSTLGVETSAALAAAHAGAGQGYVAAPVFGRPGAAASRQLWIMVAGPEPQVTRCLAVLEALGRGISRLGPRAEVAHAAKLGGGLLAATLVEALGEVLAFGEKAGLSPVDNLRLLNTGLLKSPLADAFGGLMVRRAFEPADLPLAYASEETALVRKAAEDLGIPLPLAGLLQARFRAAEALGMGSQDLAALSQALPMDLATDHPPLEAEAATPAAPEAAESESTSSRIRGWWRRASHRVQAAFQSLEVELSREPGDPSEGPELAGEASPVAPESDVPPAAPQPPEPLPLPEDALPEPVPAEDVPEPAPQVDVPEPEVVPDLEQTSHFELVDGRVYAWFRQERTLTPWKSLREVERAFDQTLFVKVDRTILLRPEAALDIQPTSRGGAKVRVGEHLELKLNRAAAERLKVVLGL